MEALHGGSPLESETTTTPLPLKELLVHILEELQKLDKHGFFSNPVDPKQCPKYCDLVKQHMDFGTIRSKLDEGFYSSFEELKADVDLICSNGRLISEHPNNVYFSQANSISDSANSISDSAERWFKVLMDDEKMRKKVEEEEKVDEEYEYELGLKELEIEQEEAEFAVFKRGFTDKYSDDDNDNIDDEPVEEICSPVKDGNTGNEILVPVLKDDKHLERFMYRDDILEADTMQTFADKLEISKEVFGQVPSKCSICLDPWNFSGGLHQATALPCGHVLGYSCIEKWWGRVSKSSNDKKCPLCNMICLDDVRLLNFTALRIPNVDQQISARRFPLTQLGFLKFHKHETGRRNFALLQWSRLRNRLESAERQVKVYNKLGDESMVPAEGEGYKAQAQALEVKASDLRKRVEGYKKRIEAYLPRLQSFTDWLGEKGL